MLKQIRAFLIVLQSFHNKKVFQFLGQIQAIKTAYKDSLCMEVSPDTLLYYSCKTIFLIRSKYAIFNHTIQGALLIKKVIREW